MADTYTHTINTRLAKKIGIEGALLFGDIYFWCYKNKVNKKNLQTCDDGKQRYFTFNSITAFQKIYDYISASTISRTLSRLETEGYIIVGNFNKTPFDKTKWYAVTEKGEKLYKECNSTFDKSIYESDSSICHFDESSNQSDEPIPDINPDINTSEDSSLRSESSSQEQPQPQKDKNTKESNIHPLAKKQNITKTNNITDSQEKIQTNKNSDAQNLPAAKRSRPKVPLPDYEEVKDIEAILLKDGTEWRPDIFFIQEMTRLHPQVDVKAEFMAMRGWCVSNPTKRKTWAGVKRFVSGWLDRAQKKIQSAGANPYGGRNYYSKPHEGFKDGQRDYSNTADW